MPTKHFSPTWDSRQDRRTRRRNKTPDPKQCPALVGETVAAAPMHFMWGLTLDNSQPFHHKTTALYLSAYVGLNSVAYPVDITNRQHRLCLDFTPGMLARWRWFYFRFMWGRTHNQQPGKTKHRQTKYDIRPPLNLQHPFYLSFKNAPSITLQTEWWSSWSMANNRSGCNGVIKNNKPQLPRKNNNTLMHLPP